MARRGIFCLGDQPIARYQLSYGKKKDQKKALVTISGSECNLIRHPCMQTAEFDISVGYGTRYGCSRHLEAARRPKESSFLCLLLPIEIAAVCAQCSCVQVCRPLVHGDRCCCTSRRTCPINNCQQARGDKIRYSQQNNSD